jgi:hypothetical protein
MTGSDPQGLTAGASPRRRLGELGSEASFATIRSSSWNVATMHEEIATLGQYGQETQEHRKAEVHR